MTKFNKLTALLFIPFVISSLVTYKVYAADSKDDLDKQATQALEPLINIIPRSFLLSDIIRSDPFINVHEIPFSVGMDTPSVIKVDISENDVSFTIRAEIPGTKKEDVKVQSRPAEG